MPFSATVNLGTVGVAITSVKLYGCTGNSGGNCTGCTALTGYENVNVSTFPLLVSGIPNGVIYIQAEALGACSADAVKQCISISGIPGATPAPTSTPTPTPTGTSAPGATPNPTSTPTPTPSPSGTTPDATPNPTSTPTPTATTALPGCGSTVTGTYAPSGYTLQTVSLDLSGAINGGTISVQYTANNRPNRFNIYGGGNLIVSSLWAGSDTDYQGPWTGNPIDEDGTGYITFVYNSSLSYQLKVDVGGANPSNILEDSWSATFSCGSPAATSTPTPTATPSYYSITVNLQGMIGQNGNLQVYQSADGITYQPSLTLTSNDGDYASSGFNGTPGYWYYLAVARTSGGTGMNDKLNLYTQVSLSDFEPGPINGAWCTSSGNTLTTQDTPFQLPNPIQSRQSIIFYGGLNEGCL
jgi:hypothetical protein